MNSKLNRYFGIVAAVAVAVLLGGLCNAAPIVSKVEDTSVAVRVLNGYTGTLTWVVSGVAAVTNTITCDGLATARIFTNGADTMATVDAWAVACTNAAGKASLTVNTEPALAADTFGLLPGTYTALPGAWLEVLWDTSVALHYDVYLPSRTYQTGVAAYKLASVLAAPGGTGNVTASIYKAGTLIARKTVVSPVYVNPATWLDGGTNVSTNSFTADAIVNLDWQLNLPFTGADAVIVRVARATTATTGVITGVIPAP